MNLKKDHVFIFILTILIYTTVPIGFDLYWHANISASCKYIDSATELNNIIFARYFLFSLFLGFTNCIGYLPPVITIAFIAFIPISTVWDSYTQDITQSSTLSKLYLISCPLLLFYHSSINLCLLYLTAYYLCSKKFLVVGILLTPFGLVFHLIMSILIPKYRINLRLVLLISGLFLLLAIMLDSTGFYSEAIILRSENNLDFEALYNFTSVKGRYLAAIITAFLLYPLAKIIKFLYNDNRYTQHLEVRRYGVTQTNLKPLSTNLVKIIWLNLLIFLFFITALFGKLNFIQSLFYPSKVSMFRKAWIDPTLKTSNTLYERYYYFK